MNFQCVSFSMLALAALAAVPGCKSPRAASREDAPMISAPVLAVEQGKPGYSIMVAVCNREQEKVKAKVRVTAGAEEVASSIAGFSASSGSDLYFTLGRIDETRKKPIDIRIEWNRGLEQGVERFTIAPGQTNVRKTL